jgi:hypothetical protein
MNIIELAKQAHGPITSRWWDMDVAALTRFAALVRAEVLEEAAGVLDGMSNAPDVQAYVAVIRALAKEKA